MPAPIPKSALAAVFSSSDNRVKQTRARCVPLAATVCGLMAATVCGLMAASCVTHRSRADFKVPETLPVLQIVSDMDSTFEREKRRMKSPHAPTAPPMGEGQHHADLFAGLLVPITEDGYCLTAAHNLGKGKSMSFVSERIGRRNFGRAYVMANLRTGSSPPFCSFGKRQLMTATRTANGSSNRFVVRSTGTQSATMPLDDLDSGLLESKEAQMEGPERVWVLPVREIRIWHEDDLALVKVPFATPAHFRLSECEPPWGARLMVFLSPGTRRGTINHVTEKIEPVASIPLAFSTFSPLVTAHLARGKVGDSGAPVMNRDGELVGINLATHREGKSPPIDLAVGLRRGPILQVIQEARRKSN